MVVKLLHLTHQITLHELEHFRIMFQQNVGRDCIPPGFKWRDAIPPYIYFSSKRHGNN